MIELRSNPCLSTTPQDDGEDEAAPDCIAPGERVQLGVTGENVAAFLPFEITTTAYRRRVLAVEGRSAHA